MSTTPHLTRSLLVGLLVGLLACSGSPVPPPEEPPASALQAGQILEAPSGRPIAFKDLIARLIDADILYLGEEHHHPAHIEAAVAVLEGLHAQGRRPVLAMEMFGWDSQGALDRYLTENDVTREQFLREVQWQHSWGGPYDDYQPLISWARRHQRPVIALNPPKALVRAVAKKGLRQAQDDPAMARWGLHDATFSDEPAYREVLFKQIRLCHAGLSDEAYQRMYQASVFRDEAMAKTLVEALRRLPPGAGPIVSYTGGGHIQYRLPVPNRVTRRHSGPLDQITIYFLSVEPGQQKEVGDLLADSIADYLWLTPPSPQGPRQRCG